MRPELLPADKLIGQTLANRYQILHRLGEGAMGAVYKARHVKVGRSFAVKVLHARLLQDPKVALRFDREAELAGRLRHANVVGVVDVGEVDGMRYMVMDFAEGPDLAHLLVEAPMPPERIIHMVRQLLEGLYHAHEQGLIHRDFKPENVIIERDAHGAELPRIVDFGIAILRDGGDAVDGQGRLTTNGLVLGTPHYMAPEQAVADPFDHRIDLFALGIVIYEMLSGRLPFDGSGAEVARANLLVDPPPIVQRVPYLEVDPLLEAFALRLMAKKPNARPANAKAARELLDLIDRDRPAAAAALGMPARSGYTPAVTQPVGPQTRVSPHSAPPPMATTRLRATPSPSTPVAPPAHEAPPRSRAAPPRPGPPVFDADPAQIQPAVQPPDGFLPPGPIVFSAPPRPVSSRTLPPSGDHETTPQTTPGWKRRTPMLLAGGALGTAALLAGGWLARSGATQDQPVVADRGVPAPISSPPTTTVTPQSPTAAAPMVPAPTATAPQPVHIEPTATEPTATAPTATAPTATEKPAMKRLLHPPRPHEPTPGDASATDPKAHAANAGHEKALDSGAAGAKPMEARPGGARAEITPDAVATLYNAALAKINLLPSDASQDLRNRWRRYDVQGLMIAPQAERDQAAEQLAKIRDEAIERLSKHRKE